MTVLVAGGDDFGDAAALDAALERLGGPAALAAIIHGAGAGIDKPARDWADAHGVRRLVHAGPWNGAGLPDLVLAYPGSGDVPRLALAAGVLVLDGLSPDLAPIIAPATRSAPVAVSGGSTVADPDPRPRTRRG